MLLMLRTTAVVGPEARAAASRVYAPTSAATHARSRRRVIRFGRERAAASHLDAAIRQPVPYRLGGIALPLRACGEAQDLLRLVLELVALAGELEHRGGGHR